MGLVIYSLWDSLSVATERAEFEAERQADYTAATLRGLLRNVRVLDQVPAEYRFEVRAGALQTAAVGWLEAPAITRATDLDILVQDKLEQLYATTDPAPARAIWRTLLADQALPADHRQWLVAEAAWLAHRDGQFEWRDDLMRQLHEAAGGAVPVASTLLHLAVHGRVPLWAEQRIPQLPAGEAEALLARLREQGVAVASLQRALEQTRNHRARLRRLQPIVKSLGHAPVRRFGEELLLFHGTAEQGSGALLSIGAIRDLIEKLQAEPWAALPAGAADALTTHADAEVSPVVAGLLAIRRRAPAGPRGFIDTYGLSVLIVALSCMSIALLWFLVRGVRRQAAAAEARSEFLTMVTHELKTPLAGIRLLSEMLEAGHVQTGEQQQDYYARLTRESVRLGMLIENVLDLGRMERGERAYDFREVSIDDVVAEAAEMFKPIAAQSGMELRAETASAGVVRADRGALLQSLLNVMENARKYAPDGRLIELATSVEDGRCRVTVRDHGPGIPVAERGAIFERFQRGQRHRDGNVPGVGLGLYLSRVILRHHGGELSVVDGPDGPEAAGGTCFRFDLPTQGVSEA